MSCERSNKPQLTLTNEQAVYESVALMYIKSMSKEVKVLNKTNGIWFQNNSFSELVKRTTWKENNEIVSFKAPKALLESLYNENQKNEEINWKPIIVNGILVPAEKHVPFNKVYKTEAYSYYSFSRVSFSNDKKGALVKFTHHCSPLCGGEWLIYLNFIENQWEITQGLVLWVS